MKSCRPLLGVLSKFDCNPAGLGRLLPHQAESSRLLRDSLASGFLVVFILILGLSTTACTLFPSATSRPPTAEPTAAPTAAAVEDTPEESPDTSGRAYSRYEDADLGIAFDYPADWVLRELGDYVAIATDENLLQTDAGLSTDDALVLVSIRPVDAVSAGSLDAALQSALAGLSAPESAEILEGPAEFMVNGYEAIRAVVTGIDQNSEGQQIVVYVTLVRNGGALALITGTTLADNSLSFQSQFDAVATSILLPAEDTVQNDRQLPAPAGELTFGQTVTGTIPAGELIVWSFQADSGDVVNITAGPVNSSLDLALDVVDLNGQTILPVGEVDNSLAEEEIGGLIISVDGIYRVVLSGFLGSAGEYELTLVEATAAFGDISPGAIITGSMEAGGSDTFTFVATEGVSLTIVAAPGPELDVVLSVQALGGEEIQTRDVGFEGEGEVATFLPELSGQYLLQLREFSGSGSGPYTLSIMSDDTALNHEDVELAADEVAYFPLSLDSDQVVVAVATPASGLDIALALVDASDQPVLEADTGFAGASEILASAPLPDGDYRLRVSSVSSSAGSFRLMASVGFIGLAADAAGADDLGGPTELRPGVAIDGLLESADTDSYTFFAQSGEEMTIFVMPTGAIDPVVDITNSAGTVLLNVDNGFVQEAEIFTFAAEESGDYQLRVRNFIATEGDYVILLLSPGSISSAVTGSIGNDTANRYDLETADSERWAVLLFPEEGFDVVLEILDESDQLVATSDIGIASEPEMLLLGPENGGSYTVRVRGFVNAGGNYRLIMIRL